MHDEEMVDALEELLQQQSYHDACVLTLLSALDFTYKKKLLRFLIREGKRPFFGDQRRLQKRHPGKSYF